jgi:hypothetical protein
MGDEWVCKLNCQNCGEWDGDNDWGIYVLEEVVG